MTTWRSALSLMMTGALVLSACTELADLRCCAFANDAPMACNADGQSVYDQIDMNPACAVPYDAYVACVSN